MTWLTVCNSFLLAVVLVLKLRDRRDRRAESARLAGIAAAQAEIQADNLEVLRLIKGYVFMSVEEKERTQKQFLGRVEETMKETVKGVAAEAPRSAEGLREITVTEPVVIRPELPPGAEAVEGAAEGDKRPVVPVIVRPVPHPPGGR